VSCNIHENHAPGPEQWALLIKWFNLHLKRIDPYIPVTPPSTFDVNGQMARFAVTPEDRVDRLIGTEIYYSYDPNARTRFWNRADAEQAGDTWSVDLTIHENLPLYVFALSRYALGSEMETLMGTTSTITVNSIEHAILPAHVDLSALDALKKDGTVFEDFSNGLRDWAVREGGRMIRSRKFQSPELNVSNARKLLLRLDPGGRKLSLRLATDSRFLDNRLNQGNYSFSRRIEGTGPCDLLVDRHEFKAGGNGKNESVLEWAKVTLFDLSIVDEETREKVDLTSQEGCGMLKLITLVE